MSSRINTVVFVQDQTQQQQSKIQSTKNSQQQNLSKQKQKPKQRTLILHLKQKSTPRVSWTEDTIDNQFMNKKKSNLCCIYHKPGQSSSDTCTSDDEGNALERDRHTKHLHKMVCSKRKNKQEGKDEKCKDKTCNNEKH